MFGAILRRRPFPSWRTTQGVVDITVARLRGVLATKGDDSSRFATFKSCGHGFPQLLCRRGFGVTVLDACGFFARFALFSFSNLEDLLARCGYDKDITPRDELINLVSATTCWRPVGVLPCWVSIKSMVGNIIVAPARCFLCRCFCASHVGGVSSPSDDVYTKRNESCGNV